MYSLAPGNNHEHPECAQSNCTRIRAIRANIKSIRAHQVALPCIASNAKPFLNVVVD